MKWILFAPLLWWFAQPPAVSVTIQDQNGAPLKNALVIVQDLSEGEKEVIRALTDNGGSVKSVQLHPGLFRVIATFPYAPWQTAVREFTVTDKAAQITLQVQAKPSQGAGDTVVVNASSRLVHVVDAHDRPVAGAKILARDEAATPYLERWYVTDAQGEAKIQLLTDPLVLVVVTGDLVVTTQLSKKQEVNPVVHLRVGESVN